MTDLTASGEEVTSVETVEARLPLVLPVAEAARLLGIGESTAYAELERTYDPASGRAWLGPIPALRIGRRWVVPTQPLLAAVGQGRA